MFVYIHDHETLRCVCVVLSVIKNPSHDASDLLFRSKLSLFQSRSSLQRASVKVRGLYIPKPLLRSARRDVSFHWRDFSFSS